MKIALAGSTYAETELTLFYGDGASKAELPVTIPPFNGTLFMTLRVSEGKEGCYVEIY